MGSNLIQCTETHFFLCMRERRREGFAFSLLLELAIYLAGGGKTSRPFRFDFRAGPVLGSSMSKLNSAMKKIIVSDPPPDTPELSSSGNSVMPPSASIC